VAVHPGTLPVEQDGAADAGASRPVDDPADSWRQRDQDHLGAFAAHVQHPVTMFFAQVGDISEVASKIRKPSSPSIATSAKSCRLPDSRAAVSRASNCRWVNPRVGDLAGTRSCSVPPSPAAV
jgi:hypothetical protein